MLTIANAEKIARSKSALIVVLLLAVSGLITVIVIQHDEAVKTETKHAKEIAEVRADARAKDSANLECERRAKITADTQTKAAQHEAAEYRKLYLEVIKTKEELKRKNLTE